MNLLFICTINRMRSCTAETIYGTNPAFKVKSAGIPHAPNQITAADPVGRQDIRDGEPAQDIHH